MLHCVRCGGLGCRRPPADCAISQEARAAAREFAGRFPAILAGRSDPVLDGGRRYYRAVVSAERGNVSSLERVRSLQESVAPVWVDETTLEGLARKVVEIVGGATGRFRIEIEAADGTENILSDDPGVFSQQSLPRRLRRIQILGWSQDNGVTCSVSLDNFNLSATEARVRAYGTDAKLVTFARIELVRFFETFRTPGGWLRRAMHRWYGVLFVMALSVGGLINFFDASISRPAPGVSSTEKLLFVAKLAGIGALAIVPWGAPFLVAASLPAVEFRGHFAPSSARARTIRWVLYFAMAAVVLPLAISIAANLLTPRLQTR